MSKLIPFSKSSLIKSSKGNLVKPDKLLNSSNPKTKSKNFSITKPQRIFSDFSSTSTSSKQNQEKKNDCCSVIKDKVIKVDKLLNQSYLLKLKRSKISRLQSENDKFKKREKELEKKKDPKVEGIKLPELPKLSLFDRIKNFIFKTFLGFIAVRLLDFLPQLLKILPVIIKVSDFIIDTGGKLLDGLVTFIDWGYKAYDSSRGFIKNIFGEDGVNKFDQLSGLLNKFLNLAIIAGMVAAGSGGLSKGKGGNVPKTGSIAGGKPSITTSGGRTAGRPDIRNPLRQRPTVTTSGGRTAGRPDIRNPLRQRPTVTTSGGALKGKALLSSVRPFLKRIPLPVIGALIDFGLSVALGENPGRAAFRAIGAGILAAIGAAAGTVVPVAGNFIGGLIGGIAGDAIGGALYDMFFTGKKPQSKGGKTVKAAEGGRPSTKSSPRRSIKKKKQKRSLSIVPRKLKPGLSVGGEDKVQKVFPNPEKPKGFLGWLGGLFGQNKQSEQQTQTQPEPEKLKGKVSNPQEFLVKSNDILGRSDFFGPFFTLAIKTVLGQRPDKLDYKNAGKGLNGWINTTFQTGTLGFAGGGEVDVREFFAGEDYTDVIAKSIEDSTSTGVNATLRNLSRELSLQRPVGREEMTQENIQKGTEAGVDEGGGGGGGGGGGSQYGTPEMRALLEVLAYAEGTSKNSGGATGPPGYSTWAGYQIHGPTDLTTQTIQQVHDLQTSFMRAGKTKATGSAVVGRYQFKDLRDHFAKQAGLRGNDLFSPANQDKMAIKEIERAGVTTEMLKKNGLTTKVLDKLAPIWASIPYSPKGGKSYYGQAYKNPDKLITLYNKELGVARERAKSESVKSENKSYSGKDEKIGSKSVRSVDDFNPIAKKFGLSLYSGYRQGSRGWHGVDRARDYSNDGVGLGTPQQLAFAKHVYENYGSKLKELIYTPLGFGVKKGKKVPLTTWGPVTKSKWAGGGNGTNAIHYDHVHVAYEKGGETLDGPHMALIGEKGKEYVIDSGSYKTVEKFTPGLLDILNYKINDRTSLQKNVPGIIDSLTKYASYEKDEELLVIIDDSSDSDMGGTTVIDRRTLVASSPSINNTSHLFDTLEML